MGYLLQREMGNCLEPEPQPQPARRRPKPQQPNSPSKRPRASNARDQPTGRIESPSAPISSPISKNNNFKRDEIVLGSSVSERREIDNDRRWKQLLDKTTTNLIDISQTTQPLDGVDAQQREVEHKFVFILFFIKRKYIFIFSFLQNTHCQYSISR